MLALWGETNVNVYGGTIEGGVYGGGFGATDYYTKAANDKKKISSPWPPFMAIPMSTFMVAL